MEYCFSQAQKATHRNALCRKQATQQKPAKQALRREQIILIYPTQ
jgi:hypothetical protein